MTTVLTFQNTHFDIVEQNSQVWFTISQIGIALGYKADDAISRIYRRNSENSSYIFPSRRSSYCHVQQNANS